MSLRDAGRRGPAEPNRPRSPVRRVRLAEPPPPPNRRSSAVFGAGLAGAGLGSGTHAGDRARVAVGPWATPPASGATALHRPLKPRHRQQRGRAALGRSPGPTACRVPLAEPCRLSAAGSGATAREGTGSAPARCPVVATQRRQKAAERPRRAARPRHHSAPNQPRPAPQARPDPNRPARPHPARPPDDHPARRNQDRRAPPQPPHHQPHRPHHHTRTHHTRTHHGTPHTNQQRRSQPTQPPPRAANGPQTGPRGATATRPSGAQDAPRRQARAGIARAALSPGIRGAK